MGKDPGSPVKPSRQQPPQALIDRAVTAVGEALFISTYSTVSGIVKPKTRTMQTDAYAQMNIILDILAYDFQWSPKPDQTWMDPHGLQSYLAERWKAEHPLKWDRYLQQIARKTDKEVTHG